MIKMNRKIVAAALGPVAALSLGAAAHAQSASAASSTAQQSQAQSSVNQNSNANNAQSSINNSGNGTGIGYGGAGGAGGQGVASSNANGGSVTNKVPSFQLSGGFDFVGLAKFLSNGEQLGTVCRVNGDAAAAKDPMFSGPKAVTIHVQGGEKGENATTFVCQQTAMMHMVREEIAAGRLPLKDAAQIIAAITGGTVIVNQVTPNFTQPAPAPAPLPAVKAEAQALVQEAPAKTTTVVTHKTRRRPAAHKAACPPTAAAKPASTVAPTKPTDQHKVCKTTCVPS